MPQKYSWESPFPLIPTPHGLNHPPDAYTKVASSMAILHNMIVRSLNSIYLQASHIAITKSPAFLLYCKFWVENLTSHHKDEENEFFPAVEKACGGKSGMEENVRQHGLFEGGLGEFRGYVEGCLEGKDEFDGKRVVEILDGFGEVLANHLAEEIVTLENLRRFPDCPIEKLFDKVGSKVETETGLFDQKPFMASNMDITYEDGGFASQWPPIPWLARAFLANIAYLRYKEVWEFSTCDMWGKPRELKYLGESN